MLSIKEISLPGYHKVIEVIDPDVGLDGFIAVHDLTLGPALGGMRMYPYATREDALNDALRLAKSMTDKSAAAEIGLGGGKSVLIGDPHTQKTESLLTAFAEGVNYLKGEYIIAEDVGTDPQDMMIIRKKTPYVAALPIGKSSGDPSPFTAWGVFRGIQAVAQKLWGSQSLKKKRILIQGLGHVGSQLAGFLFWEGAELIFCDIDSDLVKKLALFYGAKIVDPKKVYAEECDIFSPCALGGVVNDKTLPVLRCKGIAGSANNQLITPECGLELTKRGILYAPDYIINSGGVINASIEFEPSGYDPKIARDRVDHIYDRLLLIFNLAEKEKKPTSQVADEIAAHNLKHLIGKRTHAIKFEGRN